MVLRDMDCGSKKKKRKKKLSGTGFCDATPQSLDGLTRTTGASRRPWQQTQGCLPSPLASQILLPPSLNTPACRYTLTPFQEFHYCFQDGKEKNANLNSARASRAEQGGMRPALLRRSGESGVTQSPWPSATARAEPAGPARRLRAAPAPAGLPTASSPRLPAGKPQRCVPPCRGA